MRTSIAATPVQALIKVVHKVQPCVLADGVAIQTDAHGLDVVAITFHMSPELIKAWGEECAALCKPSCHTTTQTGG